MKRGKRGILWESSVVCSLVSSSNFYGGNNKMKLMKKTTNLHVSLTLDPSGTITSEEVSSAIKSGGMTTSK